MGVTQKIGTLGEELVVKFLVKKGYKILDRNFWKRWGELDIVAQRKGKIHFVEVKALSANVSDETTSVTLGTLHAKQKIVSSETLRERSLSYIRSKIKKDRFAPEDHISADKMKRLGRIMQTYLGEKHVSDETKWQLDVATVLLDRATRKAKINLIEDVVA